MRAWHGADLEDEIAGKFIAYLYKEGIHYELSQNGKMVHFECLVDMEEFHKANEFLSQSKKKEKTMGPKNYSQYYKNLQYYIMPSIKNVVFNDPATIVIWDDGSKTVVKTQNHEAFDPEKGLAMAIAKKALGNRGTYFDEIKKWTNGRD